MSSVSPFVRGGKLPSQTNFAAESRKILWIWFQTQLTQAPYRKAAQLTQKRTCGKNWPLSKAEDFVWSPNRFKKRRYCQASEQLGDRSKICTFPEMWLNSFMSSQTVRLLHACCDISGTTQTRDVSSHWHATCIWVEVGEICTLGDSSVGTKLFDWWYLQFSMTGWPTLGHVSLLFVAAKVNL